MLAYFAMAQVDHITEAIRLAASTIGPPEVHDLLQAIRECTKLPRPLYQAILDAEFAAAEWQDQENET